MPDPAKVRVHTGQSLPRRAGVSGDRAGTNEDIHYCILLEGRHTQRNITTENAQDDRTAVGVMVEQANRSTGRVPYESYITISNKGHR